MPLTLTEARHAYLRDSAVLVRAHLPHGYVCWLKVAVSPELSVRLTAYDPEAVALLNRLVDEQMGAGAALN